MTNLDGLNNEQREAVLHDKGPLLILAGAGSGKTRVITHRIAYLIDELDVNPYRIMAITFTNKAAKEMRDRVDSLIGYGSEDVWVSTFHSTCARFLRRHGELLGYDRNFSIYDTDDSKNVIKEICKRFNIDTKKIREKSFMIDISNAKNELIPPEKYLLAIGNSARDQMTAKVYAEYQKQLKANNAMDFDDLLMNTVRLFREFPEALRYYQQRFQYLMVDEYQDTNKAQFEFIHLLANYENEDGDIEHNLCVVGDDDQSIYKFRGADIRNILDFEKVYPNTKVIKLEENYRSTNNILTAANEVIRHNLARKDKRLRTQQEDGQPLICTTYEDDRGEAADIAGEISRLVVSGQESYEAFAVLYRTNAQSRAIEEQMVYQGIPYRLVGGVNFYSRREIKDCLAYLRTVDNGVDSQQVKRIINVPKRGIGLATIDAIDAYALEHELDFFEAIRRCRNIPGISRACEKLERFVAAIEGFRNVQKTSNLQQLINTILEDTGYWDTLNDDPETKDDRLANLQELINKAVAFEDEHPEDPSLSAFLSEVSLVADIDSMDPNEEKVTLMTLHSAKGLEFDHVYMVGMEEGLFPSDFGGLDQEEIEEERRLCYVGITRARKTLHLSHCNSRFLRGEKSYNRPSRFLRELPRHVVTMRGSRGSRYLSEDETFSKPKPKYEDEFTRSDYSRTNPDNFSNNSFLSDDLPIKKKSFDASAKSAGTLEALLGSSIKRGSDLYKTPTPTASPSGDLGYGVGDKVKHVKFGIGTVTSITMGSKDYEVTVDFPAGTKKMLASFAKLVKVD